ncbi:MAG: hypothetical protein ACUVWP_02260 [bacterium]
MRVKYKGAALGVIIPLSILLIFSGASIIKNSRVIDNTYDAPWSYQFGHHLAGNYWVTVWNTLEEGNVDLQTKDRYYGIWPAGSGRAYLYHGGIWVGWQDSGGNVYVISHYRVGGEKEWTPIEEASDNMWMSDESGWPPRAGIETVSDLDGWTICDDSGAQGQENGPIGLELQRHSYQWGVPGHYDWIVYHYTLKNLGDKGDLNKLYIAWPYDCDVGGGLDYIDDLVRYEGNDATDEYTNPTLPGVPWSNKTPDGIPDEYDAVNYDPPQPRGTSYMFDSEPANFEGFIGIRPFGYFGTYPNGKFIFPSSQHSWDINTDPPNDIYKYGYMIDTGVYEEIWTPYDWRICPAIGPLDLLKTNESIDFYMVNCMGLGILDLRKNLDMVLADWLGADKKPGTDDDWLVAAPPPAPKLALIAGDRSVKIHWTREYEPGMNLEDEEDTQSGVKDFDGYILYRSPIGFDTGWVAVAWWDKETKDTDHCWKPFGWRVGNDPNNPKHERVPDGIRDGTDIPSSTEPDLRNAKQFIYEDLVKQLDETTYYHFEDDGTYPENDPNWTEHKIKNGFRYYYAIVAYDFGTDRHEEDIYVEPVVGGKIENQSSTVPSPGKSEKLENVWVVPNPYIGSADWEGWAPSLVRENKIAFMNLPEVCTIDIYTLAGDWVDRIEHNDVKYGVAYWDLSNYSRTGRPGLKIASGVYIFRISTPDGQELIDKFAIILGSDEEVE